MEPFNPSTANREKWTDWLLLANARDFMLARERRKFDALPDVFTVYRGSQYAESRIGLSWSLNRDVAEMFAALDHKLLKGKVIERRVKKSECFAYICNDEEEIIILPDRAALRERHERRRAS
jgi:hypothetical protein